MQIETTCAGLDPGQVTLFSHIAPAAQSEFPLAALHTPKHAAPVDHCTQKPLWQSELPAHDAPPPFVPTRGWQ